MYYNESSYSVHVPFTRTIWWTYIIKILEFYFILLCLLNELLILSKYLEFIFNLYHNSFISFLFTNRNKFSFTAEDYINLQIMINLT